MASISKRKLKTRIRRKSNPSLVETITEAKKHDAWNKIAENLAKSRRKKISKNLFEIDKATKEGDTIVIPGKVLSVGFLNKKIRICALNYSSSAMKKIKENKSEVISILNEIKKNPKAEGIKVLN